MKDQECEDILCDNHITTRKEFLKWALRNHPDKVNEKDVTKATKKFQIVNNCKEKLIDVKKKDIVCKTPKKTSSVSSSSARKVKKIDKPPSVSEYGSVNSSTTSYNTVPNSSARKTKEKDNVFSEYASATSSSAPNSSALKIKEKNKPQLNVPVSLKKAECIRKVENWSKILKHHRFDKSTFDKNRFKMELPIASPKMQTMIDNIRKLDDEDMKTHGKLFKHFIFSDIKAGGYGAKIIASGLVANDFNSCLQFVNWNTLRVATPKTNARKETFGILSSTAIYNSPFTAKVKASILKMYNDRPGNIQGDDMRFIIFDSGFKEGIDLFDVKYVHIFETQKTSADLTQAVGRATRSCGQKGLHFVPNEGWKLMVYKYHSEMDDANGDNVNLFDLHMAYAGVDLNQRVFKDNLEKIAIKTAVDRDLNENINKFGMDEEYAQGGGYKRKLSDINCTTGICGARSTKTIPFSIKMMEDSYTNHLNLQLPKGYKKMQGKRRFFCDILKTNAEFCKVLTNMYNKTIPSDDKASLVTYDEIRNEIVLFDQPSSSSKSKTNDSKNAMVLANTTALSDNITVNNVMALSSAKKPSSMKNSTANNESKLNNMIDLRDSVESVVDEESMDFETFMKHINKLFKKYKYDPLKIENQCVDKPASDGDNKNRDRIVDLTPSQGFISSYFTPQRKNKGMLVWHSVGTGKTCTAIATKSSTFEMQDYHILWVTRTTLREDIWKNMFDKVCDAVIRERLARGDDIPENPKNIRKYLSKKFLPPMSYRQFSNTLSGKNDASNKLKDVNGDNDMIKKTLIIIDEAHKLYSKDLIGAEKPDMRVIEKSIFNSYSVSGKDSCKLLLMTATPIADDAMEFLKLINLTMGEESARFPTTFDTFANEYLSTRTMNTFTTSGATEFQKRLKGSISYLDRRNDPRQFTQAVFYDIPVQSSVSNNFTSLEDCVKTAQVNYDKSYSDDIKPMKESYENNDKVMDEVKKELKSSSASVSALKKELKKKKVEGEDTKKAQLKVFEDIVETLKNSIKNMKKKLKDAKNDISKNDKSLKETLKKAKAECKSSENNRLDQKSSLKKECGVEV
jgi:hypothetical protein